ncbi:interferon-induced GTP-binding protein Mx3-like isoform X2 [Chiloscyllium punctatum]|uniref:interferon-induced GTP-binding protein Mx3-like isoform X2 n=1 Tax=Chiloscyllium punctatum TaxID=137246 RepID=UPI003B63E039
MANLLYAEYEEKVRPYIDLIDSLRKLGLNKDLPLPTIVVIGDQSSGKSSVLEMLSEVALPRGTGIVTRCPLELKMKNGTMASQWKGQLTYGDVSLTLNTPQDVEEEIKKAQKHLAGKTGISSELISLQVESPCAPNLTLIDLPGIIRVPIGNQPQDIGNMIKKLIHTYIGKEETIILVVIACNVDIATTEALKMAQEVDPNGDRTLGVLTKPDLIDRDTEKDILKIINNQMVPLRKGYMLIKCRGQHDLIANTSLANALEKEIAFFNDNVHFRPLLEKKIASFQHLSSRLTNELVLQIRKCLPAMQEKIGSKINEIVKQLDKMGGAIPEDPTTRVHNLTRRILGYCDEIITLAMGEYKKDYSIDMKLHDFARDKFAEWYKKLDGVKIGSKVETACNTLALQHFSSFPLLVSEIQIKIAEVCHKMERKAEEMLNINFKMEAMVYAPDEMYSYKLMEFQSRGQQKGNNSVASSNFDAQAMVIHLHTYYQIAIDRLVQMVPMVLRYYLLQELSAHMKVELAQLLFHSKDVDALIQENDETAEQRRELKNNLDRLTQARNLLMNY